MKGPMMPEFISDFFTNDYVLIVLLTLAPFLELRASIPFGIAMAHKPWFVVVAKGSDGLSRPMFPVFAKSLSEDGNTTLTDLIDGNLGEGGVMALGMTNALWYEPSGN